MKRCAEVPPILLILCGMRVGIVTPYDPVLFPFVPALYGRNDLGRQPVGRCSDGPDVEECYVVTSSPPAERWK